MTRFDVDTLWKLQRIGAPSLSPDGAQAVAGVTRYVMADNKGFSQLWLMSTLGGEPRQLTACGDKDGQPCWSPRGDQIAFVAKRDQEGHKDTQPQLYLIAPDGGEARRTADVATGVEAFRWMPDGRRLVAVSWVWPGLKGPKAQAKAMAEFTARKFTGYATSEAQYRWWDSNLPAGRAPHLLLVTPSSPGRDAQVKDLFEGLPFSLPWAEPGANCFDISPDGRRVVFVHDPKDKKRVDNPHALAELDLATGKVTVIVRDAAWDCNSPRYSPDGQRVAFRASHVGLKHTMPEQLAVWTRAGKPQRGAEATGHWHVHSADWDHAVEAPLQWDDDGQSVLLMAEQQGRKHLWRFDLAAQEATRVVEGGTVLAFDQRAGTLITLADSVSHPGRLHVHPAGEAAQRIERFNDDTLQPFTPARTEEHWVKGALDEPVQVWLHYPPGFTPRKRWPVLHLIHGGPHTAFGDSFHFRWNVQAFAAAGYVVACVNYHGSSGFGHRFLDSITHRWGELELQDIEAATDWLLTQRWADKQRIYATGGSYGGYLVAWMNGHIAPGRYAAYVCHAGCFDWTAMFADDAFPWHAKELGAWYWDDMARVQRQSPHAFAAGMHTPTLVVHGALDYRVPDAQGLAYYNTLKARGVDARLLWFPDENHWVLKPQNSRQWYEEFLAWLERHGPTQGKPGAAASERPKRSGLPKSAKG
ncbi:MAG: S9 family peptidase [Rubrivivax sp.]|nr:S9 family peptidase [Rubrivivax sp.]